MALNKWRTVRYTDDGCSIFECLACKGQWEARTAPGYVYQGYHATWAFCPCCGVKWEGTINVRHEERPPYGPRRARIEAARKKAV